MVRIPSSLRRLAALSPLALAGCQPGVLQPEGPVGLAQRTILIDSMAIMLAIVVPTIIGTIACSWWFREGNPRAKRMPTWAFSGQIEMIVWSIPLLTIGLLGGVAWVGSHDLDPGKRLPSDKPALEVQVVALDWKWLFIYPDLHVAALNQLVLPAGRPVHFALTSASVMNAFFVPQLGTMIYVMNGMATELNLQADNPGTFHGLSSHYSGDGFSGMHFDVRALPEAEFDGWVKTTSASGPMLDEAAYRQMSKPSLDEKPATFRSVSDELFARIVSQALPPGPGPVPETNPGQADKSPLKSAEK